MFYKFLTLTLTLTPKRMEPKRLCLTVSWNPNGRAQTAAPKRTIPILDNVVNSLWTLRGIFSYHFLVFDLIAPSHLKCFHRQYLYNNGSCLVLLTHLRLRHRPIHK